MSEDLCGILESIVLEQEGYEERITAQLRTAMPSGLLGSSLHRMEALLGNYREIVQGNDGPVLLFADADVPARVGVHNGLVGSLSFLPPRARSRCVDRAMGFFTRLEAQVSLLATEDGRERLALSPDTPLSVGSAFKLAVIDGLAAEVSTGRRRWEDVITLEAQDRSLPSGILQDWPPGAPLTLYTLAALMISLSDNTATDTLLRLLGSEGLEGRFPRNTPFLTCREFLILRSSDNLDLRDRYLAGNEAERREVIADAGTRCLPQAESVMDQLMIPELGWHFTVRELSELIGKVADLPALSIHSGPAAPGDWQSVAFKGGSEPGLLNLTMRAQAGDGRIFTLAVTVNAAAPLENEEIIFAFQTLLSALTDR